MVTKMKVYWKGVMLGELLKWRKGVMERGMYGKVTGKGGCMGDLLERRMRCKDTGKKGY